MLRTRFRNWMQGRKDARTYLDAVRLSHNLISFNGLTINFRSELIQKLTAPLIIKVRVMLQGTSPSIILHDGQNIDVHYRLSESDMGRKIGGKYIYLDIELHSGMVRLTGTIARGMRYKPDYNRDPCTCVLFQPVYLPVRGQKALWVSDLDLWQKGFDLAGKLSRNSVLLCCVCHHCRASFFLRGYHLGFGETEFLHDNGGNRTLGIPWPLLARLKARQKSAHIDGVNWNVIESNLPPCPSSGERFRKENPLRCPGCLKPYIDYQNYKTVEADPAIAGRVKEADFNFQKCDKVIHDHISGYSFARYSIYLLTSEGLLDEVPNISL